jgi:hypothetical protein
VRVAYLEPPNVITGEDVYSLGFFLEAGETIQTKHGYFKGNIVNMASTPASGHASLTLSYPVVEGLSGAPVLTYHNGPKVVGLAFGSVSSRVVASEVVEYEEGNLKLTETVSRIVEFGLAYHSALLVSIANELGVALRISSDHVDIPGLE